MDKMFLFQNLYSNYERFPLVRMRDKHVIMEVGMKTQWTISLEAGNLR